MPTAIANGISIYYESDGEGDPLLVIPGLSIDVSEMRWMVQGLAGLRRVIAMDNRGAGRSDKPDVPYSIGSMADDAAGLLDSICVRNADVVGISLGGRIAMELTFRRPDLVRKLVLVSTSPRVPHTLRRSALLSLMEVPRRIGALMGEYPQPVFAYRRQRDASRGYDATPRLREVKVPTLILHGRKDRMSPYSQAQEMNSEIKGSKLVTFDGGHLFLFFRQKEFLGAVEEFLSARG